MKIDPMKNKKTCLNSIYHENFTAFRFTIENLLNNLDQHKKELDTLLTLKFQLLPYSTDKQISMPRKPYQLPKPLQVFRTSHWKRKHKADIFHCYKYKSDN